MITWLPCISSILLIITFVLLPPHSSAHSVCSSLLNFSYISELLWPDPPYITLTHVNVAEPPPILIRFDSPILSSPFAYWISTLLCILTERERCPLSTNQNEAVALPPPPRAHQCHTCYSTYSNCTNTSAMILLLPIAHHSPTNETYHHWFCIPTQYSNSNSTFHWAFSTASHEQLGNNFVLNLISHLPLLKTMPCHFIFIIPIETKVSHVQRGLKDIMWMIYLFVLMVVLCERDPMWNLIFIMFIFCSA